jgi:membrane fusion protein, multidrug efflux system
MSSLRTYSFILALPLMALSFTLLPACTAPQEHRSSEKSSSTGVENATSQTEPSQPKQSAVDVFTLRAELFHKKIQLPGELQPYEIVDVYPKVTGFISKILVDRGSRVRQGQLLAILVAPEMQAQIVEAGARVLESRSQIAEAKAKYMSDEGIYKRYLEASHTPGVISENELQTTKMTAQASLARLHAMGGEENAKRASVGALRQVQQYLQIHSPITGIITERDLHPGALVAPSGAGAVQPIVRIQQVDRLRLVVALPERYFASLKLGLQVPFKVSAYPQELFTGIIRRPAYSMDVKNRTELVELDVSNKNLRLTPGMFVETQWPIARSEKTFVVPVSAVVSSMEGTYVERRRSDNTVEHVDIRQGYSDQSRVEIFGDLHDGDQLVLHASEELRPGEVENFKLKN